MNLRRVVAAACCMLIVPLLAACGEDPKTDRTIYLSVPLSGPLAKRGQDMADAAALGLEQSNNDTAGTRLALKVIDSTKQLELTKAGTDQNALAWIGGLSIESVRAARGAAAASGLLQVALAPAPSLSPTPASRLANVIWQLPSAPGQGDALAQYIASLGQKDIGFFSDNTEFAGAVQAGFVPGIERAGIDQLKFEDGGNDIPVVGAGSSKGFVQADDPANSTPVSPHTLITAGMTAEAYPPAGERFFDKFDAKFGRQPDRFAIYAYEATGLVLDAIMRVEDAGGTATRAAVADQAFRIKDRFGPVGHYDVLPSGRTTLYVFQARGGDAPQGPASLFEAQR